jgi:hypothetical protein
MLVIFVTKYAPNYVISVSRHLDFTHSIMSFRSSEMGCGTQDRSVMMMVNQNLTIDFKNLEDSICNLKE